MVVGEGNINNINNIMGGIENTGSIRLNNHKRKLKQRFDIIKKLGQGTYGKVQLGINKETGQEVAIKTIKKSKIETEADLIRIRREIQIMSSVQHPNIIHIYEVFENREKMVLVMEYAAGGELYDYLSERKVLIEGEARRIFRQIATACYYCHKHKICHRDLKLENILLDENKNAKIADFGLSNVFDDQRLLSTFCGSPLYASPEIVKGTPYHGPEVDCWSLGVLLYTLVYGAMPFDGSNFKRLVKQISQGDYFEPKQPSPASPLIQEMLTVNAKNRADIEKICAHWWVNEGYNESCLEISEELANQTPVRLDVLLSLNPPPPQLESDKLVVTGEVGDKAAKGDPAIPTRSQSAGSLMDISNPAERRIKDLIAQELKVTPKRKLETTPSTEQANLASDVKRKDKIVKENTVADISVRNEPIEDVKMTDITDPALKTNEDISDITDPSLQGAACTEIIEEAKKNEAKKPLKVKKTKSVSVSNKILEEINEVPSQENIPIKPADEKNKENEIVAPETPTETKEVKDETKSPAKKRIIRKKVLSDKNEATKPKITDVEKPVKPVEKKLVDENKPKETKAVKVESKEVPSEPPSKPVERRQSRIFEQAEKFQNLISSTGSEAKIASPEKPKKIVIPGVSVGGFKKEFERKASLTSVSPPKVKPAASKKLIIDEKQPSVEIKDDLITDSSVIEAKVETKPEHKDKEIIKEVKEKEVITPSPIDEEHKQKLKNAVSIISNALDKEGTRKSKSRPCVGRKPPVPFGTSGRSASGSISLISPLSPPPTKDLPAAIKLNKTMEPAQVKFEPEPVQPETKKSTAEIILKSATLPRRKSTKAEIQLEYPKPKPAIMEFKTEMTHPVQAASPLHTQKSEVVFPVNTPQNTGYRSASLEPETKSSTVERIIPIAFEKPSNDQKESITSPPPMKPPMPRPFQSQKSITAQRSNSLSRQSTQESDTETSVSGDPIKKSPREYIIPIAVEGGGYVTPRAGSLEPSDTSSTITNSSRMSTASKFSRPRRMVSLFDRDGSEDESSPFPSLHRHCSFGKDSDTEGEPKRDAFHMHRLRSSRPRKSKLEHTDSLSSGEDDDDDDGFEFLTAENLFSTLLSRVRDLTQRINSDDGSRPGFPTSRLLSNFDHGNFWNRMEPLGSSRNSPLTRLSRERSTNNSSIPWRRSVSRDLASDINSVFNDSNRPTRTATLPRGEDTDKEDLNLSDLNLKKLKLTDEDALALSYLTPGLSRRIQKQLFASLPPSEARKISRTMSMRNEEEKINKDYGFRRRSVDRISSTLPRKFSYDKPIASQQNLLTDINQNNSSFKESNNYKSDSTLRDVTSPFSDKSSHSYSSDISKPKYYGSSSLREPTDYKSKYHTYSFKSPDSSLSEIPSLRDDDYSYPYRSETNNSKYMNSNQKNVEDSKPTRKVSRFLRPDFYDPPKDENRDKKEREMETQKVLKEIRDKRIKNRISMRRERSLSRDKSLEKSEIKPIKDENGNAEIVNCKDLVDALNHNSENLSKSNLGTDSTEKLLDNVSENIKNIESNVLNAQINVLKKERISKLMRPKSYPAEKVTGAISKITKTEENKIVDKPVVNEEKPDTSKTTKISKLKKNSGTTINQSTKIKEPEKTKSKFLQSIEKKFEKLRTFSEDKSSKDENKKLGNKSKEENKKLENKLKEDSNKSKEEANKIKEEKKSAVETTIKRLREQSVPRTTEHITESTLIKRAVSVEDFSNVKNKALQPSRKSVTKILSLFKKYEDKSQNKSEEKPVTNGDPTIIQLPNINESNIPVLKSSQEEERPKSLHLDKNKQFNGVKSSKLPVNAFRRSLNLETKDVGNNNTERKNLKLDFSKLYEPDVNLNRMSYTTDESSAPFSPGDDLSCDSWSACSDLQHTQDLVSPTTPNGNTYNTSGDESESVVDRIRRKSFYTRFNEKKKPRKNVIGNYRDLDLYKDYNVKPAHKYKVTPEYSTSSSSYKRSSALSNEGDYKSYLRSKSVYNDNHYQTYNPRRSNIASLYSNEDSALDDSILTGSYKKYSYSPNKSRLDNLNRDSRSPSTDFQYIHNSQMSTSEHSSISSPTDNMHSFTEHAV